MRILTFPLFCLFVLFGNAQIDFKYEQNETFTYDECIAAWRILEEAYLTVKIHEYGNSDCGRPIHLVVLGDTEKEFKPTLLINNGIHPGESCGIDASLKFAEDLLKSDSPILNKINIAIIPVYNIGGALNRNSFSRTNQNGPKEHGFRGNAQNLDLNRDFIKCDSRNTEAFYKIYHDWQPEIFIDTHTSNGADYQYVMTLITSQVNKLNPELQTFVRGNMVPELFKRMEESYPMSHYVNSMGRTPESGIADFNDSPRYSTGYTSLFNSIGFVTESHMLKPYRERVLATFYFLKNLAEFTAENGDLLVQLKNKADRQSTRMNYLTMNHQLDTTVHNSLAFKGFRSYYEESSVTGLDQLKYERKPVNLEIKHFNTYRATDTINKPYAYIIPQAWKKVIDHFRLNQIEMSRLNDDIALNVNYSYITHYEALNRPYEGHFLIKNVETKEADEKIQFLKGDYVVELNQKGNRFIMECLEPRNVDSFFAWNYFDAILGQKEYFSDYVFEAEAKKILDENPELEQEFREKQASDTSFAENNWAQLYFIYRNSKFYEKSHNRYPVMRLLEEVKLPIE
ncbi:MAG: M14 family metallopeptidase [Bacteroidota bacterium]